jgi:sugar phosphate isomerase/epimerase
MVDGKNVLTRMLEEFPANEYGITFDVWWAQYTGENPVKWLYALEGRTDCVHFKDMSHNANGDIIMVPNGDGIMDYDAIIKACIDTGVKFGYIEQDNCNGEDPFACMKRSYDFFRSRGLS